MYRPATKAIVEREANKRQKWYPRNVKIARVSYTDLDGIEHAVTVEARSLYHAVGIAIARFRSYEGIIAGNLQHPLRGDASPLLPVRSIVSSRWHGIPHG